MRKLVWYLPTLLLWSSLAFAQPNFTRASFFEDEKPVKMELITDLKALVTEKKANLFQPASVICHFPDSTIINEQIELSARGNFRRENCYIPSIKFDFSGPASPQLACLRKLKLVCGCDTRSTDEKILLKEYLVYKIYNLISDMSFRVRLMHITYKDARNRIKPFTQYAFVIEDVDEMAKRNQCYEVEDKPYHTEWTNRRHMTTVAMFQYMIGNLDWGVSVYHNIKLIRRTEDSTSSPYTIPYDFDFCGLVNASYALPPEQFALASVTERLYRGFPRNEEEIHLTLAHFRSKREAIMNLVTNFELLDLRSRKEMTSYLESFYKTIDNKGSVKKIFIDNARQN